MFNNFLAMQKMISCFGSFYTKQINIRIPLTLIRAAVWKAGGNMGAESDLFAAPNILLLPYFVPSRQLH